MESSHVLLTLHNMKEDMHKATETFGFQLGEKNFELAGVALGRIIQIGKDIGHLSGAANEALWNDSCNHKETK